MFRGYNKPTKSQIFGPSATGGTWADAQDNRQLYMTGEGLGSLFGSIFRKIIPMASKVMKKVLPAATNTAKKIAGSKIVQETGKQLMDSGVNAMANVAANAIGGEKSVGDSMSEELTNARKEISNALRKANQQRKVSDTEDDEVTRPSVKRKLKGKRKSTKKSKRKRVQLSVFDDDDD